MEKELKKAFLKAKYEENSDLADNIWQNITIQDKRMARMKLWAFSLTGLFSFVGLFPAIKSLLSDLSQSGFYEYLSLAFSSSGSIMSYWREFALSLAESLPTMSIILSFSLILIFLFSLKYATKQIIRNQLSLAF
jgi:hypothetical protein